MHLICACLVHKDCIGFWKKVTLFDTFLFSAVHSLRTQPLLEGMKHWEQMFKIRHRYWCMQWCQIWLTSFIFVFSG